jgi:hypothetical protein
MNAERRQHAPLGVCARNGEVMEHEALCSRYSAPVAPTPTGELISRPFWRRESVQPQTELAL